MLKAIVPVVAAAVLLSACGSTSNIKDTTPAASTPGSADAGAPADVGAARYQSYATVVVRDFLDGTDKSRLKADKRDEYAAELQRATRDYADRLAAEIRATGAFAEVLREPTDGEALVLDGTITRYASGNAALRLLVGFGAGSSYFDATVNFKDQRTGEQIGEVKVDRNSWGLGGGIAAGQTVEGFMKNSAEKIAKDLAALKVGPVASAK